MTCKFLLSLFVGWHQQSMQGGFSKDLVVFSFKSMRPRKGGVFEHNFLKSSASEVT
jgi:hypothetical protein